MVSYIWHFSQQVLSSKLEFVVPTNIRCYHGNNEVRTLIKVVLEHPPLKIYLHVRFEWGSKIFISHFVWFLQRSVLNSSTSERNRSEIDHDSRKYAILKLNLTVKHFLDSPSRNLKRYSNSATARSQIHECKLKQMRGVRQTFLRFNCNTAGLKSKSKNWKTRSFTRLTFFIWITLTLTLLCFLLVPCSARVSTRLSLASKISAL